MKRAGATQHVIASLCDIMWLLNLRGDDIPCVPVTLSFLRMTDKNCIWYVRPSVVTKEVRSYLTECQVEIRPYESIYEDLSALPAGARVLLDKKNVNCALLTSIPTDVEILDEAGKPLPPHVRAVEADGIAQVKLIDATPIGINVRSTVATYANVHDELRKVFARTPDAKRLGYKAGDFSYNTGKLRCPVCDGTGVISLDVQFLPDVEIPCTGCRGSRYSRDADAVRHENRHGGTCTLPQLMDMDINTALTVCTDLKLVTQRLKVLRDLGLGYLTLGEETPSLSGGEAQRLKLASEMGKAQHDTVFVFDEPTIGLHPLDVRTLLGVFRTLIENGATVIVIEHDLDVIRSADYLIDMGPGGGEEGGRVVACGTPAEVKRNPESRTGKFI